ncbi:MAG: hypothetical protein ACOCQR_02995 [bacterium]
MSKEREERLVEIEELKAEVEEGLIMLQDLSELQNKVYNHLEKTHSKLCDMRSRERLLLAAEKSQKK